MVGPWHHRPYTFYALHTTYGPMWLRCDVCRRYGRLHLGGLHGVDYRTKTFSCSVCGSDAYLCLVDPTEKRVWRTTASMSARSRSIILRP